MNPEDYRVELEHFAGPMDLLLHLVKKEEVDIHDIPIARILQQYMKYLEVIEELDLDNAGEFVVMAATLMVIKSKLLLPIEQVDLEEEIDPRFELVQQLLEYKRLKDAGQLLERRAEIFSMRVGRPDTARPAAVKGEDRSLSEIGLAELLESFAKLIESIGQGAGTKERRISVKDKPVREYMDRLATRLASAGSLRFEDLFEQPTRSEVIGCFLALLVLLKQERLLVAQDPVTGSIQVLDKGVRLSEAPIDTDLDEDFR